MRRCRASTGSADDGSRTPARTIDPCSKSSCQCGDSRAGSRRRVRGPKTFIMRSPERKTRISPSPTGWSASAWTRVPGPMTGPPRGLTASGRSRCSTSARARRHDPDDAAVAVGLDGAVARLDDDQRIGRSLHDPRRGLDARAGPDEQREVLVGQPGQDQAVTAADRLARDGEVRRADPRPVGGVHERGPRRLDGRDGHYPTATSTVLRSSSRIGSASPGRTWPKPRMARAAPASA